MKKRLIKRVISLFLMFGFLLMSCDDGNVTNNNGNSNGNNNGSGGGITLSLGSGGTGSDKFTLTLTGAKWKTSISGTQLSSFLEWEKADVGNVDDIDYVLFGATAVRISDTTVNVTLSTTGKTGFCIGYVSVKASMNMSPQHAALYFENVNLAGNPDDLYGFYRVTQAANSKREFINLGIN